MAYVVMVDDNFAYMDEEARYKSGEFADAEAALRHCRGIVDDYLKSACQPGMSAAELWESYTGFGEDPYIVSVDAAPVRFSAWDYARERCAAMTGGN
jgi:hypothetical protein